MLQLANCLFQTANFSEMTGKLSESDPEEEKSPAFAFLTGSSNEFELLAQAGISHLRIMFSFFYKDLHQLIISICLNWKRKKSVDIIVL